jgi:hypothetical protein
VLTNGAQRFTQTRRRTVTVTDLSFFLPSVGEKMKTNRILVFERHERVFKESSPHSKVQVESSSDN